jgi:hypothetical protein
MLFRVLILLLLGIPCLAQDASVFKPDSIRRKIQAKKIDRSLKIDGHLDESEWRLAPLSPGFIQIEPMQGLQPEHATQTRILFNRQYLYVGIMAFDSLGKKAIRATDFSRDFSTRSHDYIGISFDGFNDQRNAMAFFSNAYGVQRDQLVFDDFFTDLDWDALWRVRTHRGDSGWMAEIAIPWQTLRYPKTGDSVQSWGLNIIRNRRLSNETTAFSPFPRSFKFTRMDYAGLLQGLEPPPPRPNIRLQPYVLGSYDRYKNFPSSVIPEQNKLVTGGEIKWAINPNNILDLTFNTDFAQADVDRQVNNVTRFSVFFPERRQFFLENASLFSPAVGPAEDLSGGSMRIQPFFSRRIGLDDNGNPIPLDAGGRFVHRSAKRNFGAMAMRQREGASSLGTNFFVGRYQENLGRQGRVGGLMTIRNNPNGTNWVGAVDGFFRLSETHSLSTMLVGSSNSNGGKSGMAGSAQYVYTNNQWKIWWTQTFVTKDFDPGMGFVSRSDVIGTTPGIYWYYRGNKLPLRKWIRAFEPGIMTEFYHQASTGQLIERQININPIWFNFQNGGFIGYLINPTFQRLTETFAPLGIKIGQGAYNYVQHQIYMSTDPSRVLGLNANIQFGSYFNGRLNSSNLTLRFSPSPHLSISGNINRNYFKEVGDSSETKKADLWSISGRFALNPRVQLIAFYQKNSINEQANYNVRLSWEYQPLSFIYLVYNSRAFQLPTQKRQTDDHVILKVSYLHQL